MAGNDAVFGGSVTDGGDVDWTTEYGSSLRLTAGQPVNVSCTFDATGAMTTVMSNFLNAYTAAAGNLANPKQSASVNGNAVTFTPSGVSGMTVGGTAVGPSNSPTTVNTVAKANAPSHATGLTVHTGGS